MDLKIYASTIDEKAKQQIYALKDHPAFKDEKIRIMPDVHAGAGCVIGFTSTFTDKVVPSIVGVDIGCGVAGVQMFGTREIDFAEFDKYLRATIPAGFSVHPKALGGFDFLFPEEVKLLCELTGQSFDRVIASLGTLGGGNHFIEIDYDDKADCYWLTVHTGSRNFGKRIADAFQAKAVEQSGMRGGLEFLEGLWMEKYLDAMDVAQTYAAFNRRTILEQLLKFFGLKLDHRLNLTESVHNYIDLDRKIIRKGAISAEVGEKVIIPFNMRDGLIVGEGKGHEDWNYSAPHGAGRILGRGMAKKSLVLEDFKKSMEGIWTSCVSESTIDESPMVYKNKGEVMELIQDTVLELRVLKPVYNFKAGE